MTSPANPGDDVYLGSVLVNMHCWGMVSDLSTPGGITGTFEVAQNDGAITLDALVGPQGVPGENAPIVKMQYQSSIDDPEDLPDNLTDDPADIGKAWWVGNIVYLWDGEHYVPKQMGTQGPPGPVPNISPSVQLLDPDDPELVSEIVVSGTAANPGWLLKLKAPKGPQGDNATIRDATDYDDSTPPAAGQVIAWNGTDYAPKDFNPLATKIYSIPEAAFTNYSGISSRAQIASFPIPPQEFDWQPIVFGHIKAAGLESDDTPFEIGMEVRLGDPTSGQLIGRGFGNSSQWATVVPHYSTSGSPTVAVTPDNGVGVVPAYHTGTAGTIYVNLYNDGFAGGIYQFNKTNAQLVVMVVPVSPVVELGS